MKHLVLILGGWILGGRILGGLLARVALVAPLTMLGLALILSLSPRPAQAVGPYQGHSQTHHPCPPSRAQTPHPRASDIPMRGEGQVRQRNCARGHGHGWLHRHFHGNRQDHGYRQDRGHRRHHRY